VHNIQLGDLGTWLGSIGTIFAILFAYWVGHKEGKKVNERERRKQAESISAWVAAEKVPLPIKLSNNSGDPAYDVIVSMVLVQGAGPQNGKESFLHHCFKVLPPGNHIISAKDYQGGGMHMKPGTEIAFTDKMGQHWLKDKDGKLIDLKTQSPADYYSIDPPISWLYLDDDK
jgi:hypothetical protein